MKHAMTNDETGEPAAITVIVGLHIDANLRKVCPMPSDVRERALLMARGRLNVDARLRLTPVQPCPLQRVFDSEFV
jgi:hypothetical protein